MVVLAWPLEHDGGHIHNCSTHDLGQAENVKQVLRTMHALTHAYAGQGWSVFQHVQLVCLVNVILSLQSHQERHHVTVVVYK